MEMVLNQEGLISSNYFTCCLHYVMGWHR